MSAGHARDGRSPRRAAPSCVSPAAPPGWSPRRRWSAASPAAARRGARRPFSLGVASGDPAPDGFVLWTRPAPDPLAPDPTTPGA